MKRYVLTTQIYMDAESDAEAIEKAKAVRQGEIDQHDNQCSVLDLGEQKPGTTSYRSLDIRFINQ